MLTDAENKLKAIKKMTDLDYEKYLKCTKDDDKDEPYFNFDLPKINPVPQ